MCDLHERDGAVIEEMTFRRLSGQQSAQLGRRSFLRHAAAGGAIAAGVAAFGPSALSARAAEADRKITVLTCMDYRIDPLTFAEIHIDDARAYIVRNAGGRVDEGAIRSIIVTQQKLGTKELYVIHHTDCGMATFQSDAFNSELLNTFNYQSDINFLTIGDLQQSVRDDVATLKRHPLIDQKIPITGYVYDVGVNKLLPVSA